jgi:hypothetical protein
LEEDELIILANSRKYGGKCVAGISRISGNWIRPVSWHPHGQLDATHVRIGGRSVQNLDIVRIFHRGSTENPAQPENVMLEDRVWELVDQLDPDEAKALLVPHIMRRGPLFGNRGQAVPAEEAALGLDSSIALVEPAGGVRFSTRNAYGKRSPRARFSFARRDLDLTVTDDRIGSLILQAGDGEHTLPDLGIDCEDPVMTISLAEPKDKWCSKLVAALPFLPARGTWKI